MSNLKVNIQSLDFGDTPTIAMLVDMNRKWHRKLRPIPFSCPTIIESLQQSLTKWIYTILTYFRLICTLFVRCVVVSVQSPLFLWRGIFKEGKSFWWEVFTHVALHLEAMLWHQSASWVKVKGANWCRKMSIHSEYE